MPEIQPESQTRRRLIPLIAGAAAVLVLIVLAVFTSLDDEESRPVDTVTEPEEVQESGEPSSLSPTLPSADATSLETARAWLTAVVERDDATFRAIHAHDARVKGSVLTVDQPTGTLNATAIAERYFGGWEGFLAYNDTYGSTFETVGCEDGDPIVCTTSADAFGPGSSPVVEMTARLRTDGGLVTEVTTDIRLLSEDGSVFLADLDQATLDEVSVEFTECLQISWNRADCGVRLGEFVQALAEAKGVATGP